MHAKRFIFTGLAIVLTLAVTAGCNSAAKNTTAKKDAKGNIAITYSSPVAGALPFLPVEVAMKKGYFTDQGVDVTTNQTAAAALPAALTNNSINMSADVVYNSARYAEKGVGVKYVAGLNNNVDFQLLAANGADIPMPTSGPDGWKTTFAALKGKRIGTAAKAGPIGLSTIALLKMAGVEAGQYTLIDTPGPVALNSLKANQVDAIVTGGGFGTPIIDAGLAKQILQFSSGIKSIFGKQVNAALFMTSATIKANPDLPKKVQAAMAEAVTFIKNPKNLNEVVDIATSTGTAKSSALADTISNYEYDSKLSISGVQAALDWAQEAGITTKKIEANSLIASGATTSK